MFLNESLFSHNPSIYSNVKNYWLLILLKKYFPPMQIK